MHSYSTDQPYRRRKYIWMGILVAVVMAAPLYTGNIAAMVPITLVMGGVYYGFTEHIWKWGLLHKAGLLETPDLNGEWSGYLYTSSDPSHIDDELIVDDGTQYEDMTKLETTIEISQTWDWISVTMTGPESKSSSRGATLLLNGGTRPTLTYSYLNEGSPFDDDLEMHYGTATLEYDESNDELSGSYYTPQNQRDNHGFIEVTRKGVS